MTKFVFAYHGGKKFNSKEEGQEHMIKWRKWVESLGAALIDPGLAVGSSKTVSVKGVEDDGGANPVCGISVVEADTIERAIEMARSCPHLGIGGTIEVAQAMMDM